MITHIIHILYTYYIHIIYILYTYYIHIIYILYTHCIHNIYIHIHICMHTCIQTYMTHMPPLPPLAFLWEAQVILWQIGTPMMICKWCSKQQGKHPQSQVLLLLVRLLLTLVGVWFYPPFMLLSWLHSNVYSLLPPFLMVQLSLFCVDSLICVCSITRLVGKSTFLLGQRTCCL